MTVETTSDVKSLLKLVITLQDAMEVCQNTSDKWAFAGWHTFLTKYNRLADEAKRIDVEPSDFIDSCDENQLRNSYGSCSFRTSIISTASMFMCVFCDLTWRILLISRRMRNST